MWRRVRAAEAPVKKKTENVSASTLTFIFRWWGVGKKKKKKKKWRNVEAEVDLGSNPNYPPPNSVPPPPHLSLPSVSPRLPHLADLSPELQYEINVGPAGNERSPQEIEEEGGQKKNSARSRRSDFWHVDVQRGRPRRSLRLADRPASRPSHTSARGARRCLAAATARGEKVLGLLVSPGFFFLLFSFFLARQSAGEAKKVDEQRGGGRIQRGLVCVVPRSKTT